MDILVSFQDCQPSEQVASKARTTVRNALDRFAQRIREVRVKIRDQNAQKGGVDQRCSLSLAVHGQGELHLHETADNPEGAVHRLAKRAARLLREGVRRLRQRRPD